MNSQSPTELTLRALVFGILVGCLIGAANVCVGLKIGMTFGATLTCAVVCFALARGFEQVVRSSRGPVTEKEILISATSGSAAAAMASAAGMISFVPALKLMGTELSYLELVTWGTSIAFLGVFFAVPLRRSMVTVEKLRFPSGTATAETITAMFASSGQAVSKARMLLYCGLGAAVITLLFNIKPLGLKSFRDLGLDDFGLDTISILGVSLATLRIGLSFSPMIWGAGILVGPRVGWTLLGGSLAGWLLIAPWLIHQGVITPKAYGKEFAAVFEWLLWPGVSIMIFAGFTSLGLRYKTVLKSFKWIGKGDAQDETTDAPDPFPFSFWLIGMCAAAAISVVFTWLLFDIPPWMGALAILLSFIVCSIAVRAVGETDINPSGPMAKITQMVYGFLDPGQVTTNLMAAGVTKAGASQAADLMLDLKAGYLLKASIRRQVFAQLIGVLAGVFAVAAVYQALMAAYQIPGKEFTGPAVQAWRAMAKVLSEGFSTMPAGAGWAALAAGALGVLLTLASRLKKIAHYLPSPIALGMALLIPGYYAVSIWLAALLTWAWKRRRPEQMQNYSSSIASGLIAGEAIIMVLVAVLLIAGVSWI